MYSDAIWKVFMEV